MGSSRQELTELRTETARFFLEADGAYTAEIHGGPINYRTADGTWADIDSTLVPASVPGFAWKNRSGPLTVEFAPTARSSDMVAIIGEGGTSLRFGASSGNLLSAPLVVGDGITYPNVYPGVDIRFEVRNDDLKEALILKQRPKKGVSYTFPLTRIGLIARQEPSGTISLLDSGGNVAFRIPHAWMTDSAVDPHSGEPARSDAVTISVNAGGTILTVTPDSNWLQNSARVYPVTIDPSVTKDTTLDTFIQSNIVGGNSTSSELKSGTYDGGGTKARSLFKFDVSSLNGKDITSATFSIYEKWAWSCSARQVNAYRITESWSSSVDWSPQPSIHTPAFDTTTAAKGFSSSCPAGRITFDASGVVQNWTNGTNANYGIELRGADETDSYYWKKYDSVETANDPYLSISYDSYPTAATSLSPTAGTIDSSPTRTTPALSAVYNDPDSGDTGHVNYQVCATSNCSTVVVSGSGPTVNPGTASPWTVPTGKLASGTPYWWRAQSDDGPNTGPWTATRAFTPDLAPTQPAELLPNTGLLTAGAPTLSARYDDPDQADGGFVHFEIYTSGGALVAAGDGTSVAPGEISSWTPSVSLTNGGSYSWRAWAKDGYLQSASIADRSEFVALGGDVYHATVYDGDPASGGNLLSEEWARINSYTARYEDEETVQTRSLVTCPASFAISACEEVGTVSVDDPSGRPYYAAYTAAARSRDLDQIVSLLGPANDTLGSPTQTGALSSLLAPWQTAPPVAGSTYELYETTDAQTGSIERFWIDARTRLPLKHVMQSGGSTDTMYWSYASTRVDASSLPADFFRVAKPTNAGVDERVEFHGDEPIGTLSDIETATVFRPVYIGPMARIPAAGGGQTIFCLARMGVARMTVAPELEEVVQNGPLDPDLEPDPSGPETAVIADYVVVNDEGQCEPGNEFDEPDLSLISEASTSSAAEADRDAHVDLAVHIQSDPSDPDYARAGVRDVQALGVTRTSYIVPVNDEETSGVLIPSNDNTTVLIDGDFDKTTIDAIAADLVLR